ncbi:fibrinogen-like protein 1 [Elysia marginata]|uniref:Fibrinogen-like protein 1 n=1 Tax=Elysia marginata TaxID=1093978 RepID=A0AAV4H1N5_9GAST|nr:fibrinogen-like protein 1 [Elysia marginata]
MQSAALSLELSLERNKFPSTNGRATCGIVCVEETLTSNNATQTDDSLSDTSGQLVSISSLQVFKQTETFTANNSRDKTRRLLASVSSQHPRLTRVANGVKVSGRLEAGRAILRLELVKETDCLAEFVCQAKGIDSEGRIVVSTSQILQQPRESNVQTNGIGWSPGSGMQMISLLQQVSVKLEVLSSSVSGWEEELRRMKDTTQHDFESLKAELNTKTDRVEDKIQSLGKDLNTQTDRLEDKMEDSGKAQNKKISHLEDKTETLITRLEDKIGSRLSQHTDFKASDTHSFSDSVERIVRKEIVILDEKISTIKDDITLVGNDLASIVNVSFLRMNERLESWKNNEQQMLNNLTKLPHASACQDTKDLASVVNGEFDSLESLIEAKFHEIAVNVNLSATETRSLVKAESFKGNTSFDIKSALSELLKPKHCYKGMSTAVSLASSPYTVTQPNQANNLAILCDTFTDGGGWVVFQRRFKGDVSFYRVWEDYKRGFGSLSGDFWLGNDNIHALTKDGVFELRIDMMYNGNFAYAHYDSFSVGDESSNYALRVAHYSGTAGDALIANHNGMPFTTHDRDNDVWSSNCAIEYVGAWWYKSCHLANLNGQWGAGVNKGPRWSTLSGTNAVTYSEMKLRRVI